MVTNYKELANGSPITHNFKPVIPFDAGSVVIVWLFTDKRKPIKFSTDVTDTYGLITFDIETGYYSLTADSTQTKDFCGDLYIGVMVKVAGANETAPNATEYTGLKIIYSPIAEEIV